MLIKPTTQKAIIICGPTGTSPGALAFRAMSELGGANIAVLIDKRHLAQEDEHYIDLLLNRNNNASNLLSAITKCSENLLNTSIDEKKNIVINSDLFSNSEIVSLCGRLIEQKYFIEFRVLSVNLARTQLVNSTIKNDLALALGLPVARLENPKESSSSNIIKVIEAVQNCRLANNVIIYSEDHLELCSIEINEDLQKTSKSATAQIELLRNRPWSAKEHLSFIESIKHALSVAEKHNEHNEKYIYLLSSQNNSTELVTTDVNEAAAKYKSIPAEQLPSLYRAKHNEKEPEAANNYELMTSIETSTDINHIVKLKKIILPQFAYFQSVLNSLSGDSIEPIVSVKKLQALSQVAQNRYLAYLNTTTYKRALAFDTLPEKIAISQFPELKKCYAALRDIPAHLVNTSKTEITRKLYYGELEGLGILRSDISRNNNPVSAHQVLLIQDQESMIENEPDLSL